MQNVGSVGQPATHVQQPFVKAWILKGHKFTLYCIAEALSCSNRAIDCFHSAIGQSGAEYQQVLSRGIGHWIEAVGILSRAKQNDTIRLVYYKMWQMHPEPKHGDLYGEYALCEQFGHSSTPLEKITAIQTVVQELKPFVLLEKDPNKNKKVHLLSYPENISELRVACFWYRIKDMEITENRQWNFCPIAFVRSWIIDDKKITLYYLGEALSSLESAIQYLNLAARSNSRDESHRLEEDARRLWREAVGLFNKTCYNEIEKEVYKKIWKMKNEPDCLDFGKHAFNGKHGHSSTPQDKITAIEEVLSETFGSNRPQFVLLVDDYLTEMTKIRYFNHPYPVRAIEEFRTKDIYETELCQFLPLIDTTYNPPEQQEARIWKWIIKDFEVTLFRLSDGFSLLNRAASCFNEAMRMVEGSRQQEIVRSAMLSWNRGIKVFNMAGHPELETYVYHKIWKMHGKPDMPDYGRVAFHDYLSPSPEHSHRGPFYVQGGHGAIPRERYTAITAAMRKIFDGQELYEYELQDRTGKERVLCDVPMNLKKLHLSAASPRYTTQSTSSCLDFIGWKYQDVIRECRTVHFRPLDDDGRSLFRIYGKNQINLAKDPISGLLAWRIVNNETRTITWHEARFNEDTKDYINGPNRPDFLKDFDVQVSVDDVLRGTAGLRKKVFSSQLDETGTVKIDRDHWSLTLASIGASCLDFLPHFVHRPTGHAVLYYEGVIQGQRFLKFCHFTEIGGFTEHGIPNYDKSHIHTKTITFRKTKADIELMLKFGHETIKFGGLLTANCLFNLLRLLKTINIVLPDARSPEPIKFIQKIVPGLPESEINIPSHYIDTLPEHLRSH